MNFINDQEIAQLKEKLIPGSLEEKAFMHETFIYILTSGGKHLCGLPVHIVGMRAGPVADGPFYVDLIVDTPVPDFYTYMQNVHVDSMALYDRQGTEKTGTALCKPEDISKVIEIINAPRFEDGLTMVVNNSPTKH